MKLRDLRAEERLFALLNQLKHNIDVGPGLTFITTEGDDLHAEFKPESELDADWNKVLQAAKANGYPAKSPNNEWKDQVLLVIMPPIPTPLIDAKRPVSANLGGRPRLEDYKSESRVQHLYRPSGTSVWNPVELEEKLGKEEAKRLYDALFPQAGNAVAAGPGTP